MYASVSDMTQAPLLRATNRCDHKASPLPSAAHSLPLSRSVLHRQGADHQHGINARQGAHTHSQVPGCRATVPQCVMLAAHVHLVSMPCILPRCACTEMKLESQRGRL